MGWIIAIGILALLIITYIGIYNNLIKRRNWVEESFSQIDVQLQRRNDLIPNIVNTVKGYANHESETLENVTQARQQLINLPEATSPVVVNEKANELTNALSRLLAVAEQYPDLKANTNFQQLQSTLEKTEQIIATARQLYNSSATQYNNAIQTVPNNIVANMHNFQRSELLVAPEEVREVPEVQF